MKLFHEIKSLFTVFLIKGLFNSFALSIVRELCKLIKQFFLYAITSHLLYHTICTYTHTHVNVLVLVLSLMYSYLTVTNVLVLVLIKMYSDSGMILITKHLLKFPKLLYLY